LAGTIAFLFFSLDFWNNGSGAFLGFTNLAVAAEYVRQATGPLIFGLICFGIFMGAMAKSAQVPLHTWLPDAMEGPTPISALIHAATMVAAGVYLIARAYPLFVLSHTMMTIIFCVGAGTAFIAATIAITQRDIKRILAYSTCSQLGFMVMAMGVGAYSAGLFHLFTHAYFKAMLFLCSGAIIHGLSGEQDVMNMGGLRKHMPVVAIAYLIGTLSISGILLSGFWSKDEILTGIAFTKNWVLFGVALLTAGMTSFYMFRSYFLVFEGKYRGTVHPHNPTWVMLLPLVLLAIPSTIIGFALSGKLEQIGIGAFKSFVFPITEAAEHPEGLIIPLCSLGVSLAGLLLAAALYSEKIAWLSPAKMQQRFMPLYKMSFNKWFFDELYNFLIKFVFVPFAKLLQIIDKYVIDGIVNLVGLVATGVSRLFRLAVSGSVQTSVVFIVGGLICIAVYVIFIV
jgi:proton-translocating NADH-quinone oxidoreductase chain L